MDRPISVAIETSCRQGGLALGAGDALVEEVAFSRESRHAAMLIPLMRELLARHGLGPSRVDELYVSVGPGSLTGLRVGITAARTWMQACPGMKAVAVPSVLAVAENAAGLDFEHLAVLLDIREGSVYTGLFERRDGQISPTSDPQLLPVERLDELLPRPVLALGEALGFHQLSGHGITVAGQEFWLPRPAGVWQVGRRMARQGQFVDLPHLRPMYTRKPDAVRLWESQGKP